MFNYHIHPSSTHDTPKKTHTFSGAPIKLYMKLYLKLVISKKHQTLVAMVLSLEPLFKFKNVKMCFFI